MGNIKIKEEKSDDIALFNSNNGTKLVSFYPDNVTSFESYVGKIGEEVIYLKERIEIMCGNEEITEYIYLDSAYAKVVVDGEKKQYQDFQILISTKKHFFVRNVYKLSFLLEGLSYYIVIKTNSPAKVDLLMKGFFKRKNLIN